LIIINGYIQLT